MDFLFDTLPDGVTIVRGALDQNAQQDFVKTCREIISGHFGWRTRGIAEIRVKSTGSVKRLFNKRQSLYLNS